MQFPESWLRSMVDPGISSEALAHQLTMAGLEVEETEPVAPPFTGVVVAEVIAVDAHPNADKLRVCQVRAHPDDAPVQIVCGAPNVRPGMKAPLATIGARLPGDFKIGKGKLRGIESFGMLCSGQELGLSQDHDGLMDLPADAPVGECIRRYLDLDDTLLTLKLTPNKADCLSVYGIGREVAALTGATLTRPSLPVVTPSLSEVLPVKVEAPDLCGRFAGRVLRGVDASVPTPAAIRARLERCGVRSISILVDLSNYVMLERGRPNHVFDLTAVQGGLTVRWGRAGESLALLNGQTVEVDGEVGVIADEQGLLSLAGIMGGESSSVTEQTQNLYLEAAFWWPEAIAGRSRRFNFSTDAGHRFERGVDFEQVVEDLDYLTSLIVQYCGGQAGPIDDQRIQLPERKPVRLRTQRCQRILGVEVSAEQIADIFDRLGLSYQQDEQGFVVTPPSYRFDIEIEEDLIEEVARLYGFDNIPDVPPLARAYMRAQAETRVSPHALRGALAARDYQEVINFSFVEEAWERDYAGKDDPIRLLNPIASHLSVMRSSLIAGLVATTQVNLKRKIDRVRVFELGRVFRRDSSVQNGPDTVAGVSQPMRLAGLAYGPALEPQWGENTRQVDFFDVKADVEALLAPCSSERPRFVAAAHPALHPGRCARIELDGVWVGWIGELHPKLQQQADLPHAPVVFELDAELIAKRPLPALKALSRQPVVSRDLALWVPENVTVQAMFDTLKQCIEHDPELAIVREFKLFDVWRDKNASKQEKSLAFHFLLQDAEVTLDDARVDACMNRLREALESAHQARLRV